MDKSGEKKTSILVLVIRALRQYSSDLGGLLLVSSSVILILGLLRITSGSLIDGVANLIRQGFGWLAYFVPSLGAYIGVMILTRRLRQLPQSVNVTQILYWESALFLLCAFLSILGGQSVERATFGLDGGVIGWGLAKTITTVLPLPFGSVIITILLLYFLLAGLNLWTRIIAWVDQKTGLYTKLHKQRLQGNGKEDATKPLSSDRKSTYDDISYPPREGGLPPLSILLEGQNYGADENYIHQKALDIEKTLHEFGFPSKVAGYRVGPTVIQYAVEPGFIMRQDDYGKIQKKKVRVAQISALQRDLALALSVERLRIEAPIPNHSFIGIEIPNPEKSIVHLRPVMESVDFQKVDSPLAFALGTDVSGISVAADLKRMPHVLIAGTTGSGKSVCITSILSCLLMQNSPNELRIAIMDPKMVELTRFNGLPHLLGKVETEPKFMLAMLNWAIKEMEDRYKKLEMVNARDLDAYNEKMMRRNHPTLPRIVIFIDELASLMTAAPEQTEECVIRLAQMARATGIHLVVATQRPSTDILTGLIKANLPARIAFMVASSVDSRVILDTNGAETLMGRGDLLFLDPDDVNLQRAQGIFIEDIEIDLLINYWQELYPDGKFDQAAPWEDMVSEIKKESDELFDHALSLIQKEGRASASLLQRRLRIGYPRAAYLMDELEKRGYIGPPEGGGRDRTVLNPDGDEDIPTS